MTAIFEGWQCVGCGKIDVDRPCIGVCRDQRVQLVLAEDYHRLLARNKVLESIARRLQFSKPHADAWEASFKALQDEATRILSDAGAPIL